MSVVVVNESRLRLTPAVKKTNTSVLTAFGLMQRSHFILSVLTSKNRYNVLTVFKSYCKRHGCYWGV